jgi:hypothetical protein
VLAIQQARQTPHPWRHAEKRSLHANWSHFISGRRLHSFAKKAETLGTVRVRLNNTVRPAVQARSSRVSTVTTTSWMRIRQTVGRSGE